MSTDRPLIPQVVLAADWHAAYTLVWQAAYAEEAARQGLSFAAREWVLKGPKRTAWPEVRKVCLMYAADAAKMGNDELACAWTMLGADPSGPGWRTPEGGRTYLPVFRGLARTILADTSLLDDDRFCEAVEGWRFLELAGSDGEDDLIVAAQRYGAMSKVDKERILAWARIWIGVWE